MEAHFLAALSAWQIRLSFLPAASFAMRSPERKMDFERFNTAAAAAAIYSCVYYIYLYVLEAAI